MRQKNNIKNFKPSILFVVDGQCEKWYLQKMKEHENLHINLEPKLYKKKAPKDTYQYIKKQLNHYDKIYWIVDIDALNHDGEKIITDFKIYYSKLMDMGVQIIVNNPCLEYWFLLHYQQTSKWYPDYSQLYTVLKKHLPKYDKTEKYYKQKNDIYKQLKPCLTQAIQNASLLGNFDIQEFEQGKSEMFKLFDKQTNKPTI